MTAPAAPDLAGYAAVHTALRGGARRMAAAAGDVDPRDRHRVQAFARYWRGYAGEVLAHHHVEDDTVLPALMAKDPAVVGLVDRTDDEHGELDRLMAAVGRALAAVEGGAPSDALADALRALAQHMDEHLDFEDAEILPRVARAFTGKEFAALEEEAAKNLGIGAQAAFTVPFIGAAVGDAERAHLFAEAPLPFKVIYRLTRRHHARLTAAALGEAAARDAVPV